MAKAMNASRIGFIADFSESMRLQKTVRDRLRLLAHKGSVN
jgi:hypothetical protein